MPQRSPSVVIVGAGFGGLGAAIELSRAGYRDVTVLEKADDLGGVWRDNTYPGAARDVPSPLYSYSFAPNPDWPRRYSGQRDILAYLRRTAAQFDVERWIRFGAEVSSAQFDERRGQWQVHTADGAVLTADVLVTAVGQLSRPSWPRLEGLDTFTGTAFHSAQWCHDDDLRGKRVAVVGTGASAIQFIPLIQRDVARLSVFQRTAPYLLPKLDTAYSRRYRAIRRHLPVTRLAPRAGLWLFGEWITRGMIGSRLIVKIYTAVSLAKLRRGVADPALRAKLTPNYPAGCKRVLFANDYYPALAQPNVELVTEPIAAITPAGVRTADGAQRDFDVIIYATGFATNDFLAPMTIRGIGGRDLDRAWPDGARAYLGLSIAGFPNLFLMYGPNTNVGAGSIIYMLEAQARYVRSAVELLAATPAGTCVDVRAEVAARFDAEIQDRMRSSVWSHCSSWYRTASGRVTTNWPGQVAEYRRRTRRLDPADYLMARTASPGSARLSGTVVSREDGIR